MIITIPLYRLVTRCHDVNMAIPLSLGICRIINELMSDVITAECLELCAMRQWQRWQTIIA